MSKDTSNIDTEKKILKELAEMGGREEKLPDFLQIYSELLEIQMETKERLKITIPKYSENVVSRWLHDGKIMLPLENFSPDWDELSAFWGKVVEWQYQDESSQSAEVTSLKQIASDRNLLKKIVAIWYQEKSLAEIAAAHSVDTMLLKEIAAATAKPFIQAYAEQLMPQVQQEYWRKRYCPICGGKPDFCYLEKEEGARYLVCSRCDTEWLYLRVSCAYCGTQHQPSLAFFTDDAEKHLYRVYVCNSCKTYIKTLDLRCADKEMFMPLERLLSWKLDQQMQEKGYHSELQDSDV